MGKLPNHIPAAAFRECALHPLITDVLDQKEIDPIVRPPGLDDLIEHCVHVFNTHGLASKLGNRSSRHTADNALVEPGDDFDVATELTIELFVAGVD